MGAARAAGDISALLCIRGGNGYEPRRTPDGKVIGTRLFHVGRDTPWGMVLRTHFFIGQDLADMAGMPPAQIEEAFPGALGPNMLQHTYDEFSFLSRLLPGIWTAEGCTPESITRPW